MALRNGDVPGTGVGILRLAVKDYVGGGGMAPLRVILSKRQRAKDLPRARSGVPESRSAVCRHGGSFAWRLRMTVRGVMALREGEVPGLWHGGAGHQASRPCYTASPVSAHGVRVRRSGLVERMSANFRSRRHPLISFSRAIASSGAPKVS